MRHVLRVSRPLNGSPQLPKKTPVSLMRAYTDKNRRQVIPNGGIMPFVSLPLYEARGQIRFAPLTRGPGSPRDVRRPGYWRRSLREKHDSDRTHANPASADQKKQSLTNKVSPRPVYFYFSPLHRFQCPPARGGLFVWSIFLPHGVVVPIMTGEAWRYTHHISDLLLIKSP
jgi:hypothetical protein